MEDCANASQTGDVTMKGLNGLVDDTDMEFDNADEGYNQIGFR